MSKPYKQLNEAERDRISYLKAQGFTHREIGKIIGRDHRTIGRELKRNDFAGNYFANMATTQARIRKITAAKRPKIIQNDKMRAYIIARIKCRISPVIISQEIPLIFPGYSISHETIYQYIYSEEPELTKHLIRGHVMRKNKKRYHKRKSRLRGRTMIHKRPEHINNRSEEGHWESDSAVGKGRKGFINVLVERKTRLTIITPIPDLGAESTKQAIIKALSHMPSDFVKSITFDNGPENALHKDVAAALKINTYFCHPYNSHEKGTVENTIGLIRIFLPKKTDLRFISAYQLSIVQQWLNDRPRKCLNFKSSYQAFSARFGALPF